MVRITLDYGAHYHLKIFHSISHITTFMPELKFGEKETYTQHLPSHGVYSPYVVSISAEKKCQHMWVILTVILVHD